MNHFFRGRPTLATLLFAVTPAFALLPVLAGCGSVTGLLDSTSESSSSAPTPASKPSPSEAPPVTSDDAGDVWLAFGVSTGTEQSIHVVRPDGTQLRRLPLEGTATSPAFSANGRALAYAGDGGIFVLDLANGQSRRLTTGSDDVPAWSPDGKRLAFTRGNSIFIVAADGTGERAFITGPPPGQPWFSNYGHPAFDPEGSSLFFDIGGALQVGAVDGGDVRSLFSPPDGRSAPMVALSPDGLRVAVATMCSSPFATEVLALALADAGRACEIGNKLGSTGTSAARPAWSAGDLIAYASSWYTIDVVEATGGRAARLIDTRTSLGGGYVREVAWSRPGTVLP